MNIRSSRTAFLTSGITADALKNSCVGLLVRMERGLDCELDRIWNTHSTQGSRNSYLIAQPGYFLHAANSLKPY